MAVEQIRDLQKLGKDFCEALGLPADNIRKLTVTLEAGHLAKVDAEYLIITETKELETVLQKYRFNVEEVDG